MHKVKGILCLLMLVVVSACEKSAIVLVLLSKKWLIE